MSRNWEMVEDPSLKNEDEWEYYFYVLISSSAFAKCSNDQRCCKEKGS